MCLWTPSDMCKEHDYVRFDNIWWHNPDFDLEKGLRSLAEDLDVRQMCNIGMVRDWGMHIYFEHPIDTPKISQKAPNEATIDEDFAHLMCSHRTMAPHCLEDDERADMGEDDGGKDTGDEDRSYEASDESSGDDYESTSDSPYRPPLFQYDDEYEEE
ncbi:hypothetical protein SESBI_10317 [Sesbania bispinosa]|nr:hypothetical protein SESBI_10317 [Sesbania bispinosa]